MKLTDVLALILRKNNVGHVFGLQGGAVVHIFDSIENAQIGVTYTHHEQTAALASVAYSKMTENLGCVVVTTGPGATNAMTGLLAAWQDSIPCVFISGQVRSQHTSYGRKVRQVGTQEVGICDIVRPITKYCKFIDSPNDFQRDFEEAIAIARSGRPGPVWIDLPLEFQWSEVDYQNTLNCSLDKNQDLDATFACDEIQYKEAMDLIRVAKNPLFIFGYGVRLARCKELAKQLTEQTNIPFVTTWTASDLFPTGNMLNLGVIGMSGQLGANKAIFNADLLICLGTHLSIPHTTTLYDSYAPNAKKIIVNIDENQLENLNIKFDLKINADLRNFMEWASLQNFPAKLQSSLLEYKTLNWYAPESKGYVDANIFVHELTKNSIPKCLIIDGGGTALYAGFQSSVINDGDRIICSSAISAMGTGLAEIIGASKAGGFQKYYCIIGDGSFLMNIQDLQTIKQDNINVVICVINNNGYLAIRHTQREFLGGRYHGTHPDWNLEMPSISKLASGFQIPYMSVSSPDNLKDQIKEIQQIKGPLICDVIVSEEQAVLFRQGYKRLENGVFQPQSLDNMEAG